MGFIRIVNGKIFNPFTKFPLFIYAKSYQFSNPPLSRYENSEKSESIKKAKMIAY
jgi:hypothetical protein